MPPFLHMLYNLGSGMWPHRDDSDQEGTGNLNQRAALSLYLVNPVVFSHWQSWDLGWNCGSSQIWLRRVTCRMWLILDLEPIKCPGRTRDVGHLMDDSCFV